MRKAVELVNFEGADKAEVEKEGKREIQNAESSSGDSADDSGDDTESEAESKQISAPTPVLFESKLDNSKTPEGGQTEGGSSSSDSGSGSDSGSDSDSDGDNSDDEEKDDVQGLKEDVGNVTDLHKIAPKLIKSQEGAGGSKTRVKAINVFGLNGQDNSCHNDRDANDALESTNTGNPITNMTTTAMPFTQEPLSCNIQSDCDSASDNINIGRTLDDINNRMKSIVTADKSLIDDHGSILSDSVAHSVRIEEGKSKSKSKSIESSSDTTRNIKIKTLKTSDSDSSSSSGDDDSNDESSVDYQPAPKKPPLALMVRKDVCLCVSKYFST